MVKIHLPAPPFETSTCLAQHILMEITNQTKRVALCTFNVQVD